MHAMLGSVDYRWTGIAGAASPPPRCRPLPASQPSKSQNLTEQGEAQRLLNGSLDRFKMPPGAQFQREQVPAGPALPHPALAGRLPTRPSRHRGAERQSQEPRHRHCRPRQRLAHGRVAAMSVPPTRVVPYGAQLKAARPGCSRQRGGRTPVDGSSAQIAPQPPHQRRRTSRSTAAPGPADVRTPHRTSPGNQRSRPIKKIRRDLVNCS